MKEKHEFSDRTKVKGSLTLETALVLPVVMMVIAAILYLSFYAGDAVKAKSLAYNAGICHVDDSEEEFVNSVEEEMEDIGLFVSSASVETQETAGNYQITLTVDANGIGSLLSTLTGGISGEYNIKIEKKMSTELMYGIAAISD